MKRGSICLAIGIFGTFGFLLVYLKVDMSKEYIPQLLIFQIGINNSGSTELKAGYFLKECNCLKHRNILTEEGSYPSTHLKSACSEEADWYGSGQHVVSYTLYEDKLSKNPYDRFDAFIYGLSVNIERVKLMYPGWVLRIYSDHELNETLCSYACLDELMWCDVRQPRMRNLVNLNFRLWRFMPLGDPTVDKFISRDLDSYITDRERNAVAQWESSNFTFHCARDVAWHPADMYAGGWGAKNYGLSPWESLNLRWEFMRRAADRNDSLDEILLSELVYKRYPTSILAHDAYRCEVETHKPVPSVPFPTQRHNRTERFAICIRELGTYEAAECPSACRPAYGQNWTYC